jgi:hypothetical protein
MTETLTRLAHQFQRFGERECLPASPLYARLAVGIAGDEQLLRLAAAAQARPVPNLFFGAVQYVLLTGIAHPLAAFYPALSDAPLDIQQHGGERPLALVEVGASAGLNLLWDRYHYDYGEQSCGDPASPVQLHCALRGPSRPPLPQHMSDIASRIGLDLHPIDVHDEAEALWLRALIWPGAARACGVFAARDWACASRITPTARRRCDHAPSRRDGTGATLGHAVRVSYVCAQSVSAGGARAVSPIT